MTRPSTAVDCGQNLVSSPNNRVRVSDKGILLEELNVRFDTTAVPTLCFVLVDLDARMVPQLSPQHGVDVDNAIRPAYDVDIVQECQQMFVCAQPFPHCDESSVLPQCEQSPHQRVTLLPALSLNDIVHNSPIVLPNSCGRRAVELGDKWEYSVAAFHGPQSFQTPLMSNRKRPLRLQKGL